MKIIILLLLLSVCLPSVAQAIDEKPATAQHETRIIVDEDVGVIRFFIEGEEQARLTSDGLLVRGNVEYGGTMRDAGTEVFKAPETEPSEASDAP